jgi:hypothetical protein
MHLQSMPPHPPRIERPSNGHFLGPILVHYPHTCLFFAIGPCISNQCHVQARERWVSTNASAELLPSTRPWAWDSPRPGAKSGTVISHSGTAIPIKLKKKAVGDVGFVGIIAFSQSSFPTFDLDGRLAPRRIHTWVLKEVPSRIS